LSVTCIAIIFFKIIVFYRQKKAILFLLKEMKKTTNLSTVASLSRTFYQSSGGKFLGQSLSRLKSLLEQKKLHLPETGERMALLSGHDFENLEALMNQELGTALMEEEIYLPILGTSAAVAPLAGLFGTIWGLIYAFINISQEKSVDISIIAPGIAAALLTTLAGLIVAIPAMVAFHYFSNELRKREAQLNDLGDLFLVIVRQTLMN
jgi:biopolymer transport protein TolQ